MKILIAVPNTNIANGITSSAINFSNEMVRRGHSVSFLDMSNKMQNLQNFHDGIVAVKLTGKSKLWDIDKNRLQSARGLKKLGLLAIGGVKKLTIRSGLWHRLIFSKISKNETYDVAIAFRQCAPCYSLVLHKVKAKKKVAFIHGELAHMGDISSWDKYFGVFDRIACVSGAVRDQFSHQYPAFSDKFVTVYNMIDHERLKRQSREPSPIDVDQGVINVATVARLENAFKRIDWIVEICERLKRETDLRFHWYVIGGNGPDAEQLFALAEEKQVTDVLTFTGSLPNPYAIVGACDFTVLPSKSESYGMVVVESLVLGKPAVVARYPALCEIMKDGEEGLVADQSFDSVYENVLRLMKNQEGILDKLTECLSAKEHDNLVAYRQFMDSVEFQGA